MSTAHDADAELVAAARAYFDAWNAKDLVALRAAFADGASLRDWDMSAHGADAVVQANANIFDAVPAIAIDVLDVYACAAKRVATCEIVVALNDEAKTALKVVDVIAFDEAMKITAVRAYKG